MSVTITEGAATEMMRVVEDQKDVLGENPVLRIGVNGGGCSGFEYKLGFDKEADEANDHITTQHGLTVAVNKKSALYLDGTTIDFCDDISKRGFVFNNPNAQKSCGCGQSFSC